MSYINSTNLFFRYRNSVEDVLKNVNFNANKGEITAIIGESGSGKSTLLRILAGLEVPQKGKLTIDDRVLIDEETFIPVEKRGIGMVFQDYALFPHLSVEKNVLFGMNKKDKKLVQKRIHEVLDLVSMKEFIKRYPHELSGGQQQRIALARALAPRPGVILLDEPFSNLDANLQGKIRNELKTILKTSGETAVFVSHDKDDLEVADNVMILYRGEVVQTGTPKEIFENPKNEYVRHILGI